MKQQQLTSAAAVHSWCSSSNSVFLYVVVSEPQQFVVQPIYPHPSAADAPRKSLTSCSNRPTTVYTYVTTQHKHSSTTAVYYNIILQSY